MTVTDAAKASQLGPLGAATASGITEATAPETVKTLYERDKGRRPRLNCSAMTRR